MKTIVQVIAILLLLGCSTSKELNTNTKIDNIINTDINDSTTVNKELEIEEKVEENIVTKIEEEITETVKDSTNNIVVERVIKRTIEQEAGNLKSSELKASADTTYTKKEKTQEIKDESTIQQTKKESSSSNIKYIFYTLLRDYP